jgi:hypothetical protein
MVSYSGADQQAVVFQTRPGYIGLDTYDPLQQHVVSHHFRFGGGRQARVLRSLGRASLNWPRCNRVHRGQLRLTQPEARTATSGRPSWI